MISKIWLKIHVLRNKALYLSIFLSLYLSLSLSLFFVSFSFSGWLVSTGVIILHWIKLGHMRSTGGFMPVPVWVSYKSMSRGKSERNHPNASVTWSSVPKWLWVSHESMAIEWEVCTNSSKCLSQWCSRAVQRPHTGQKLESLWVISQHVVRALKNFQRF